MSAQIMQENQKRYYDVDTRESEGIVYVNWLEARNLRGLLWMYRNMPSIRNFIMQSEGLVDVHVALVSYRKVLLVSYWESKAALHQAYKDQSHIEMMRYAFKYPDHLNLGNETYHAPFSTRYLNNAGGFAHIGNSTTMNGREFMQAHGSTTNQAAMQ